MTKHIGRRTLRTDLEMRQTLCPWRADRLPFLDQQAVVHERNRMRCSGTDCNACWGVAGQQADGEVLYYCARCN